MKDISSGKIHAADAVMILDILEQVLLNADNPVRAGNEISEILRELTGAKTVTIMLVDRNPMTGEGHKMLVINPRRRHTPGLEEVLVVMAGQSMGLTTPCLWSDVLVHQALEVNDRLCKLEMENSILAPLVSAGEHVGCLLLLGLPEEDLGRTKVLRALKMFSNVLALTIRNVLLYEDQEKTIASRTAELTEANQALYLENKERKQAESKLRIFRNYLENIIDSMPSVLICVDINGHVTLWNKTAELTSGIDVENARGKPVSQVFPHMQNHLEQIMESINTGKIKQEQSRLRQEGDSVCYEDITIYPLITNSVEGAVIRIDDVSDQVRLREMMVQNEKMLSVGGLAAGMAHEINNPLAGMIQTAHTMADRLTNLEMERNQKIAGEVGIQMEQIKAFMQKRDIPRMIDTINKSGRRVADIVSNMLSFARKSDDVIDYHDLCELMDRTVDLAATDYDCKKHYDFKTIKIIKRYPKDKSMVPCESVKIQQVLLNILRNGAQAMQGIGTAGIQREPRFALRIQKEPDSGMMRIEIEDNGPGMDANTCKRIFEPFFTTKPMGAGTGLGLSVSYFIIVENHGGTMNVESVINRGTRFIIRLPLERK